MIDQTRLIGCDWGTSSFRLMLINHQGETLATQASNYGISRLKKHQQLPYLIEQLHNFAPDAQEVPMLLCGMVGSSLGLVDAGYLDCPTNIEALAKSLQPLPSDDVCACIVPGLRIRQPSHQADVMRGEETQIAGWLAQATAQPHALLCLPGTHSKWVQLDGDNISHFQTRITGELYACLSETSVLVQGIQVFSDTAFDQGLNTAFDRSDLLGSLFTTRTQVLFSNINKQHAASYLSGLLIGTEITEQPIAEGETVHLIGNPHLNRLYQRALNKAGVASKLWDGSTLSAKGLWHLYQQGATYAQ